MKFMVTAALLFASVSAHAITLKTCVVKNTPSRSSTPFVTEKTIKLANGRANLAYVGENTKLLLSLASVGANADVWVNDQFMFIFKGDVTNGQYESAWDRGTIQCDLGQDVAFIYQSKPGGFTYGAGDFAGLAGCYAGDAKAAGLDIAKMTKANPSDIAIDRTTGTISAPTIERQCVKGHGTNPDDYVCEKYGNVKVTYAVENCDYDPTARP